jgi:hypothetical protein
MRVVVDQPLLVLGLVMFDFGDQHKISS